MVYGGFQQSSLEKYFSRNLALRWFSREDLMKLQDSVVTIIGVGGLGTVSAEQMSALGVGTLRLIDPDEVEFHNLPRQKLYSVKDVGKLKVDAAKERLMERNPFLNVQTEPVMIHEGNARDLLQGSDVIIDALDNFEARRIVNKTAYELGIPWVFGGATASAGNALTVTFNPGTPCIHCLYAETSDESLPTCETVGVYPPILAFIANYQVMEALSLLLGRKPRLEGNLLFMDLEVGSTDIIPVKPRPDCPVCGAKTSLQENMKTKNKENIEVSSIFGEMLIRQLCGHQSIIIHPKHRIHWDFERVKQIICKELPCIREEMNFIEVKKGVFILRLSKKGVITVKGTIEKNKVVSFIDEVFSPLKGLVRT